MSKIKKFGTLAGVYTPSILTILGVIMYMRMGWVVGNAGLWGTILIVVIAHVISVTTGLSVASIATDKKIEAGGIYYMLSRSLGLPMGGAIGITLFLGTALSIALYLVGFSESLNAFFGFGDTINDYRITGTIALLVITIIAFISTSIALKTQFFILAAIVLSLVSIFFGSRAYAPDEIQPFLTSSSVPLEVIFAIFFPAVTGFTAGVAMSGDLKDPKKSIPVGTILAIATGLIVYIGLAVFISFTVDSDTLKTDNNILMKIALFAPIVVAGIWGATLSSALGGILGGPRIMQALSVDKVTPKIFGKGFGKGNEPRNALILTFFIAEIGVLIGELDAIAEVVSMFYLAAYGFINLSALLESWASSDYRPTFKVPKWVAAVGAIATFAVMFKLNAIAMVASLVVIGGIFLFLTRKQLSIGSGDVWQSVWSSIVRTGLKRMDRKDLHKRNWEPNILLFTGSTGARPHLISFSKSLAGRIGMISNFDLIEKPDATVLFPKHKGISESEDLKDSGIFSRTMECQNVFKGIEAIASTYGFSGVEPNTVLMGWAKNTKDPIWFAGMTRTLSELDYNVLYLDHDKERGFGKRQLIDIWWRGINNHGELTLILLKFLLTSEDWHQARVRILMVNEGDHYRKEFMERNVQTVLDEFRVSATVKVINNELEGKLLYDIMKVVSADADLIMVDIPEFETGDEAGFVAKTNELVNIIGTTLLVKASSHFDHAAVEVGTEAPSKEDENRAVVRPISTVAATALPLPADPALAAALEQTRLELTVFSDKIINEQISVFTSAYKRLILQLDQEASRHIRQLDEKWTVTKKGHKHRLLLNSQMDYLSQAAKIVGQFEKNHLEVIQNHLAAAVEGAITTADGMAKTSPQFVLRTLSDDDIQKEVGDNQRIKRIKWRKRLGRKFSKKSASHRINYNQLTRYALERSFLKNFNLFLTETGISGQSATNLLWKYASGICADWYTIWSSEEDTNVKMAQLHSRTEKSRTELESEVLDEMDLVHDRMRSFLVQSNRHFINALISDLTRIDVNYIAEQRLNKMPDKKFIRQELLAYPAIWKRNQELWHHYTLADLHLLRIKRALEFVSKQLTTGISRTLFAKPLRNIQQLKSEILRLKTALPLAENEQLDKLKLDVDLFTALNQDQLISRAVDTSKTLSALMPDSLELMQEESINEFAIEHRKDIETHLLALTNLTDHILENQLIQVVQKEVDHIPEQLRKIFERAQHATRLVSFSFSAAQHETDEEKHDLAEVLERAYAELERAEDKLETLNLKALKTVEDAVEDCQGYLSAHAIVHHAESLEQYIRQEKKLKGIRRSFMLTKEKTNQLFHSTSQLLSRKRSDLARASFETKNRQLENVHALVRDFVEKVSPKAKVMDDLPFYYRQLFVGNHLASTSSIENRGRELQLAEEAVNRLKSGITGGILIIGEPRTGKTFLCERIIQRFLGGTVYRINPPLQGSVEISVFEEVVAKAIGKEGTVDELFDNAPDNAVVLLNNIELWWERQPQGMNVLNRLGDLIEKYSHRLVFIFNMNITTFQLVEQLNTFSRHFLATIRMAPLSVEQVREVLMTRHYSGGIPLQLNGVDEEQLTDKKLRKLFTRYGTLSKGNVGVALQQWLGHIVAASDTRLTIQWPEEQQLPDLRNADWLVLLGQFVLHDYLSMAKIQRLYASASDESLVDLLTSLKRAGLIEEKGIGIYCLNPYSRPHVIARLQSKQFISQ